jgi:hypothetical protein
MDQYFATRKCPFLGSSGRRVQLAHAAALYCRVSIADQTCARQERDLRAFAKKAGYKVVGVWKGNASGAKQEVLALAQARKVDVILVTELTRRGRSARIAARSLTCFKFRFVSSPRDAPSMTSLTRCGSSLVPRACHFGGARKPISAKQAFLRPLREATSRKEKLGHSRCL